MFHLSDACFAPRFRALLRAIGARRPAGRARSLPQPSVSFAIHYALVCEAVEEAMALYARQHRSSLVALL
eukprot:6143574-Pyramimonas_sp.AAC.1